MPQVKNGKWVIYEVATGTRFERFPVDARKMIECGEFSAEPIPGKTLGAASEPATSGEDGAKDPPPPPPADPTRAVREATLKAMKADELKGICAEYGIKYTKMADAVTHILEHEFPATS